MTGPELELRDLTVGYTVSRRRTAVLSNINATLRHGEFVALVGPNGAGKSTLLRTLANLQAPLAGRVLLAGHDARGYPRLEFSRQVAVVLTDRIGVDHLRVFDLVALGRHPHLGTSHALRPLDRLVVDRALATVSASGLGDRLVSSLSDGQRQRVLIARALAQEPRVLLLDEPTSFLDPAGRIAIMALLRDLSRDHGTTILCSTHEVELALRSCDRLWVASGDTLTSGTPAALAADGTLVEAFSTEGVTFSAANMRFVERTAPGAESARADAASAQFPDHDPGRRPRRPVDGPVAASVEQGQQDPQRISMGHQDGGGVRAGAKLVDEGAEAAVDVGHGLAPTPANVGDVGALGHRLGDQVAVQSPLEDAPALFAQEGRGRDGKPERRPDDVGGLDRAQQVARQQQRGPAPGEPRGGVRGLGAAEGGQGHVASLPGEAALRVPRALPVPDQMQPHPASLVAAPTHKGTP